MTNDKTDFLLYPIDTGEDPACLACGKTMSVAAIEERGDQPSFITFRCMHCGRTEREIGAITGHASLREITRYTKAADQKRLARSAIQKVRA